MPRPHPVQPRPGWQTEEGARAPGWIVLTAAIAVIAVVTIILGGDQSSLGALVCDVWIGVSGSAPAISCDILAIGLVLIVASLVSAALARRS